MEKDSTNSLIPSTVASSRFGVTNDYIGLLCRQKKVQGTLFGRTWYVEPHSLQKFLDEKKVEREMRHTQLSKQLKQEYHKNNPVYTPAARMPKRRIFRLPEVTYNRALAGLVGVIFVGQAILGGGEGLFANTKALVLTPLAIQQPTIRLRSDLGDEVLGSQLQALSDSFIFATRSAPEGPVLPTYTPSVPRPVLSDVVASAITHTFSLASFALSAQPANVASSVREPTLVPLAVIARTNPSLTAAVVKSTKVAAAAPVVKTPAAPSIQLPATVYVTQTSLTSQLQKLTKSLQSQISQFSSQPSYTTASIQSQFDGLWKALALTNRIDQISNVTIVNSTLAASTIPALSSISGLLTIGQGGTGTSSAPTYGKLLVGNSAGTYDLLATSSLGISGSGSSDLTLNTLNGAGLSTCNSGNVLTWSGGLFGCAADQTATGAANPFTWATNFGVVAAATSSALWAQSGLFASSTSHFAIFDFFTASGTALTLSGTGYFGTASSTNVTISSVATGNLLKTTTAGSIVAAVAGTDYVTPTGAFDFTPTTNFGVNTSATSTPLNATLGIFASSTSYFVLASTTSFNARFATTTFASTTQLSVSGTTSLANLITSASTTIGAVFNAVAGGFLNINSATTSALAVSASSTVAGAFNAVAGANFGTANFSGAITSTATGPNTLPYASSTALTVSGTGFFGNFSSSGSSTVAGAFSAVAGATFGTGAFSGAITSTATGPNTLPYASSTALTVSGTGYFGNFSSSGSSTVAGAFNSASSNLLSSTTLLSNSLLQNSTSSTFAITSVTNSILKTTNGGSVIAAVAGVDYATPAGAFDFTNGVTNFATAANSTSTLILLTGGLSASSTVRFGNAAAAGQFTWVSTTGNLGLGTSSPYAMLTIENLASSTQSTLFAVSSSTNSGGKFSTSTLFSILSTGNVGLGTSSPFAQFTIFAGTTTNSLPPALFAIASSSSGTATTTLFQISNTGSTTVSGQFNATGGATFGTLNTSGSTTIGSTFNATNGGFVNLTSATTSALAVSASSTVAGTFNAVAGAAFGTASFSGAITSTATGPNTLPYASSTALTVSGTGFFGNFSSSGSSTVAGAFNAIAGAAFSTASFSGAITSTATGANTLPYASSTALTVSGTGFFGNFSSSGSSTVAGAFSAVAGATFGTANFSGAITSTATGPNTLPYASSTALTVSGTGFFGNFSSSGSSTVAGAFNAVAGATFGTGAFSGAITSTATGANTLPYASSTALTVSGTGYFGTASTTNLNAIFASSSILTAGLASTTNLNISSIATGNLLKTTTAGSVIAAVAGADYATPTGAFDFAPAVFAATVTNATSTALQLKGGLYASSTVQFGNAAIAGQFTFLGTTGNLGLGTSSPYATLTIENIASSTNTTLFAISSSTNAGGVFSTSTMFSITNTNKVGIGTSSPFATLSIAMSSSSPALSVGVTGSSSPAFIVTSANNNGNVGIGTTSPFAKLSVVGTVAFNGLSATTSTTTSALNVCIDSQTFEVKTSSVFVGCIGSSKNFKHDIAPLSTDWIHMIEGLKPVSFVYNQDPTNTTTWGFIAEEVDQVDPHLAAKQDGVIYNIVDRALLAAVVGAVQQLSFNFDAIASSSPATTTPAAQSYATQFLSGLFARITTWLADATNGLGSVFAGAFHAKDEICVDDQCLTKDDIRALLELTHSSPTVPPQNPAPQPPAPEQPIPDTEAPTITLNGNNPAALSVGETYTDLGALVTDNTDRNIGYFVSVDGGATTTPEQLTIDTSAPGEHHILYSATDQAGNTATASRSVVVSAIVSEATSTSAQ